MNQQVETIILQIKSITLINFGEGKRAAESGIWLMWYRDDKINIFSVDMYPIQIKRN